MAVVNGMHAAAQHSSSRRRISVCVDDFGMHAGVNAAAVQLAARGRVQAASALVGGPAWKRGAALLRSLGADAPEVGLHLDLTEFPCHPGMRFGLTGLVARAYGRGLDGAALAQEIAAQLDAFEAAMGRAPDYVDGHQHVHQLPMVRDALVAELVRRYPLRRPWLRATRSPPWSAHGDGPTACKSHVISLLGSRGLAQLARSSGLPQNGRLLGVYGFGGTAAQYRDRLQRWLACARDGDLLMSHASLQSLPGDALAAARYNEYCVLDASTLDALLEAAGVVLRPMGEILATPAP